MRVRALSIHADYACRSSGACCRSGWEIPVEPDAAERIHAGIGEGRLHPALAWSRPVAGLPHGAREALRVLPSGDCVFLERGTPRLCALQRQLGEAAMPAACRQFPRVATLTPTGVSVTLSHYCPTAAALLFRDDVPLAIVTDPPAFPASGAYEGLDAEGALPPLLRPGVLMDWPSLERWEAHAVSCFARPELTPEQSLDRLESTAEVARRWTPAAGAFGPFFEGILEVSRRELATTAAASAPPWPLTLVEAFRLVAGCVPRPERRPSPPDDLEALEARFVAPAWRAFDEPVRRWLAAKAFASWTQLQGEGLRTCVFGLRVALGVLRAEAARGCLGAGRLLDAALLNEAIRRADLLLLHLADPEALARRLSRCESAGAA